MVLLKKEEEENKVSFETIIFTWFNFVLSISNVLIKYLSFDTMSMLGPSLCMFFQIFEINLVLGVSVVIWLTILCLKQNFHCILWVLTIVYFKEVWIISNDCCNISTVSARSMKKSKITVFCLVVFSGLPGKMAILTTENQLLMLEML